MENGIITSVTACDKAECGEGFLMHGLIDVHIHMGTMRQKNMLNAGITVTCDFSESTELVNASKRLSIISSKNMAMGL